MLIFGPVECRIEPARHLISERRLDIGARIPLAEAFINQWPLQWGVSLYEAFLFSSAQTRAFGETWKTGIGDLTSSYLSLLMSIRLHGFDLDQEVLAVDSRHVLTGAHRVAAQIVNDGEVKVAEINAPKEHWTFKDLIRIGLSEDLANAMCMALIRYSSGMRYVAIFSDGGHIPDRFQTVISELVLFRPPLTISLSDIGRRRIFELMYGMHPWWSPELLEKFEFERFGKSTDPHVHILIFDEERNGSVVSIKERLRELRAANETERIVHGSDNLSETVYALQTLMFSTGRHFLNSSPIGSEENLISEAMEIRADKSLDDLEPLTLGGSSALEAYGIRRARDVDVLLLPGASQQEVDNAVAPFGESPISSDRLILDPRLNVAYRNVSFLSLPTVMLLKAGRGEEKDRVDIGLVNSNPLSSVPIFMDTGAEHKARRYRSRLRLKNKARQLLYYLPEPLSDRIRSQYRILMDR